MGFVKMKNFCASKDSAEQVKRLATCVCAPSEGPLPVPHRRRGNPAAGRTLRRGPRPGLPPPRGGEEGGQGRWLRGSVAGTLKEGELILARMSEEEEPANTPPGGDTATAPPGLGRG